MAKAAKVQLDIEVGKTYYGSGKKPRHRRVVGFESFFVLYKTVSSRGTTSGVPMWDFKQWAKGIVGEEVKAETAEEKPNE